MANERTTLVVAEILSPIADKPFRILETFMSADGYRTRVCDGHWATAIEAETARQKLIDRL